MPSERFLVAHLYNRYAALFVVSNRSVSIHSVSIGFVVIGGTYLLLSMYLSSSLSNFRTN